SHSHNDDSIAAAAGGRAWRRRSSSREGKNIRVRVSSESKMDIGPRRHIEMEMVRMTTVAGAECNSKDRLVNQTSCELFQKLGMPNTHRIALCVPVLAYAHSKGMA